MTTIPNEVIDPQVGTSYRVQCAKIQYHRDGKIRYVPVIGPVHRDPQLGQAAARPHIHIDGRFTDGFGIDSDGLSNMPIWTEPESAYATYNFLGVHHRIKKCIRTVAGLYLSQGLISDVNRIKLTEHPYGKWYATMIGKSCKGKKCPHFGTTMIEREGYMVCPMHNLIGDIEKEIIVYPGTNEPQSFEEFAKIENGI